MSRVLPFPQNTETATGSLLFTKPKPGQGEEWMSLLTFTGTVKLQSQRQQRRFWTAMVVSRKSHVKTPTVQVM